LWNSAEVKINSKKFPTSAKIPEIHFCGHPAAAENENNGKQQFPFVCCKQKTETANFRFFTANGKSKWNFVFLGRQTRNGNQRLLFRQTCPSMQMAEYRTGRRHNIQGRTANYWSGGHHRKEHIRILDKKTA
jgi:hypothetical protein